MFSTPIKVGAVALILAVFGLAAGGLCAAGQAANACTKATHPCCHTPRLVGCDCGSPDGSGGATGPVQGRITIGPDLTVSPVSLEQAIAAHPVETAARIDSSPPHRADCDLLTLFATLLI